jgi:predicted ATPase/class 3 adenylate cyclase
MTPLPTGAVTFLFTDIEDSTQLWEQYPDAMQSALARHDSILREAIETHRGHLVKMTGDGVHAVFEQAVEGVRAALAAQHVFQTSGSSKNSEISLRVRMGLHTGEAELRAGDYYGQAPNRAARIMSAAHGGQIVLSGVTAESVREYLSPHMSLLDLGEHRLKDLIRPEHLFQVIAPDLPREFPALRSLNTLRNNLPLQLTSFIGREREIKEARQWLASTRLLTFIGPGGTGKTQLSLHVAAEELSDFRDGAWLVELAPLADPAFVVSTMASVFEIREVPGAPLLNLVLDYLRARQLLLILDNCEHLIEASAQLADQLLHACPQLKIMASSREALGIAGETVFRVPPMSLPQDFQSLEDFGSLMQYEAARLFIERAAKAEPRFRVTEADAPAIAQICRRLDGIPLAIELAAARVKLFTPAQIAERLDDRFRLLTGGSRTALPRQQTLRALIDWSYQTLNETEQHALRRLAVFSGGWTFEAAESVLGESGALEGLLGLVNKSLVHVEGQAGKTRYRFLGTLRHYALEKLFEAGEAIEARQHHLEYSLHIARQSERWGFGAESLEWLDQMEMEHDNLRAALEWSAASEIEKAIQLAIAMAGFWNLRDYNHEARAWCRKILERSESLPNLAAERAKIHGLLGWCSITIGDHKAGRAAAEAGVSLAKQAGDTRTLVRRLTIITLASTAWRKRLAFDGFRPCPLLGCCGWRG